MTISRTGTIYRVFRGVRGNAIRISKRLRAVHSTAYIHNSCHVARDLRADEYVFMGRQCVIPPGVSIGRYTMLASNIAIVGGDHIFDAVGVPTQFSGRPEQLDTVIGKDAWIGHGVILMRGIHVGDGSVVAAGAVVTKDVPPFEVWAGVPARKLRDRFDNDQDVRAHTEMLDGPLVQAEFAPPRESQS